MSRVKRQLFLGAAFLLTLLVVVIIGYHLIRAGDIQAAEGKRQYQAGKFDLAEESYSRAVKTDPQDARSWLWLGLSRKNQGKNALAAEALQQATQLEPSKSTWWLEYAEALMWSERFAEAEDACQQAITKMKAGDPRLIEARVSMARAMAAHGEAENAVRLLEEMLERGDDKNLRFALAEVLAWSGRFDESARQYRWALGDSQEE